MKAVVTKDVKSIVQGFASDTITPLKQCDFKLHGISTYIKTCHMDGFGKMTDPHKERYADADALLNDRVIFQQLYKITPFKIEKCTLNLDYTINKGEFNTHPVLMLKPTSVIPFQLHKPQQLFALLVQEFNKIKAMHGMLIGLFSDCMIADLKELVKRIYSKKFTHDAEILLFDGIEPELSRPSELLYHFKKKSTESQITEVNPGELIVEFIKPVYGKDGLNARGKRVARGDMNNREAINFNIDEETIEVKEDDERILLYSKKRGFVQFDGAHIEISNKIKLDKVKRVQSKVAQEEKNEVEVVIAQDDITQDSVGEGVELTSEVLHITGHVGDKTKLEAKTLTIEGATHNGSTLYAREATVNRHKGLLRCHKAHIKLLEGGEVHGTNVHIDAALGGTVCAETVTIGQVKHNLKVYATKSITIQRLSGEDNSFTIDHEKVPIAMSHIKFIEEDLAELRYRLEEANKHSPEKLPYLQEKINLLKSQIERIQHAAFEATITIEQRVEGLNTITFTLPKKKVLVFKTRPETQYEPFSLERDGDNVTLSPVNLKISL